MGSQLKIESEHGCGTRISVQVPLVPATAIVDELKANTPSR